MAWFDTAFMIVVGVEGGYVNDHDDPGGETKYGISKRRYPKEDIAGMTLDRAKFLYKRDYWDALRCDLMPWNEALCVFDCEVNGGAAQRWHGMYSGNPDFVNLFQAERLLYLAGLPGWYHDGRGWARRVLKIAQLASRGPIT